MTTGTTLPIQVTLLRHAQSEGNARGLFQGQSNYPLSPKGRNEAALLADYWEKTGQTFQVIYTSPLDRALETAQIIATGVGNPPVITDHRLLQQDFGSLSERSIAVRFEQPFYTPYDKAGATGESDLEVYLRAGHFIQALANQPFGQYLVVAHGTLLNMLLFNMLNIPLHPNFEGPRFAFSNTGFANLDYLKDRHRWVLNCVNQQPHLVNPSQPDLATASHQITFVRHAQSEGNAANIWQGQAEFPLSPFGISQAHTLAEIFKERGVSFTQAIASPLGRARKTAEILCENLNISLETDPVWSEMDNGMHAGLTEQEALARVPQPEYRHIYHPIGGHGESEWDLYLRASQAIATLMSRPPASYLVVSHGGTLNAVFMALLGIPPFSNHSGPRFRLRNCSFSSFSYLPRQNRWVVLGINVYFPPGNT